MENKPRVLIVDDVSSNIHMLMSMLKENYILSAATNGAKALELATKHPKPDIILLDILMPEMDGYEVLTKLRDNKSTINIPVVFITSIEDESQLKIKADDFICKPFSKNIIMEKIDKNLKLGMKKENRDYSKGLDIMKDEIKKTILVIDDSPENIQVMIEVLKVNYTVSVATSGKKALDILSSGLEPDLILLDVIMPGMDGYELCEILKENPDYKSIPIIFVTILENEQDIVRGFELGAVDYVVKPIEPIVLNARIKTHLRLKDFQDKLIEDIKQKDELLLNQSKMAVLGEMFENITHQWKQPLSSISVSTSGIKVEKEHEILTDDRLMNFIDSIDLSVKHLTQTIDDFKSFVVNDTKQHKFNLKDIVNKTIKLLQIKFKSENILIETQLDDVEITNYQNDLIQVLMNILSNAFEALFQKPGEKQITINLFVEDKFVCIEIRDNAGGISDGCIDKIFEKYFTTKKEKEGSGVGLYMSKQIIDERLNGKIEACNKGNGACFKIYLPL